MKLLTLTLAFALTLAGCAAQQRGEIVKLSRPDFPQAEYDKLAKTGTATVSGQVFLKTRGGDVKVGAGNPVILNPVTSYSRFAYENRLDRAGLTAPDARLYKYMRETIADASGKFTFKNVPDGDYYVAGTVKWEAVQGGAYPHLATQGGVIWKPITIKNGESVEVMVTQ